MPKLPQLGGVLLGEYEQMQYKVSKRFQNEDFHFRFHHMLTCHVTILKFVEDLWEEIKMNIQEFKIENSGEIDQEVSEWLMAIDYMIPMADNFIKYELPKHMEPIPSWMISLIREVKQLLQVWMEDVNISQFACQPTPGVWSEWSGIEFVILLSISNTMKLRYLMNLQYCFSLHVIYCITP